MRVCHQEVSSNIDIHTDDPNVSGGGLGSSERVPAPLLADSSLLPSHHSQDVSAVADVTTALAG